MRHSRDRCIYVVYGADAALPYVWYRLPNADQMAPFSTALASRFHRRNAAPLRSSIDARVAVEAIVTVAAERVEATARPKPQPVTTRVQFSEAGEVL